MPVIAAFLLSVRGRLAPAEEWSLYLDGAAVFLVITEEAAALARLSRAS